VLDGVVDVLELVRRGGVDDDVIDDETRDDSVLSTKTHQ
jgi:hypothetical protein